MDRRTFVYQARPILARDYGRALVTNGSGARATVDGLDVFHSRIQKDVRRFGRSFARLVQTRLLVTVSGLDLPAESEVAQYLRDLDGTMPHLLFDVAAMCARLPEPVPRLAE